MRMRRVGQAQLFGLIAIVAATALALPASACDDGNCDSQFKGLVSDPAQPAEAEAPEPAKMEKPLPLVNRKAITPRTTATSRNAPRATAVKETVKDAHAQARDSDIGAQPEGTLTEADRVAPPWMPIVPSNEVNEIDEAAPAETKAAETKTAAPAAVEPASSAERPMIDPQPRLSVARVEPSENVTVARSDDDSAWDKSSLIGKIFIAFGGLLTAASAIRMFIG